MNIVYNASAGTGKTYQVTGLYEKLVLEQGIDPREILLMTFTDNAAAELRLRVSQRFQKARRQAEAESNDDSAECARLAMAHLPSAPIGTIHAYCTRLLREHALEAGLSPSFSVLVGDEQEELLDRIAREELLKHLAMDTDFKTFCEGAQMIGMGNGLGASITETAPRLIAEAGSLGIQLDQAESMLPTPQPPIEMEAFRAIHARLNALGKRSKKIEEAMILLGEGLAKYTDPIQLIEHFNRNFKGHFSYGEAKTIYPDFKTLREETIDRERYRERYPAARAFTRYIAAVARRYHADKHQLDAVDFDDLLQRAAELLKKGRAKPRFRYVIVDEVQDTSRIQCELIQALHNDETHLIICGDKKQSIYTWRGADPQVMPDLETRIRATENHDVRALKTSFRSKAPVLEVVNHLFTAVYGEETYGEADRLEANPNFATPDECACIEYLAPDDLEEEVSRRDKVAAEMEAIAHRIQLLVEGDETWQPHYRYRNGFEPVSPENRYRYADILVLLRRTTHLPALEQALRHAGIPYTLGGKGRGLFTRQEVQDVSLFLNVMTQPGDALSLIGFLRSPWIGLSDETIATLAHDGKTFSIEHLLLHFNEQDQEEPERAQKEQNESQSVRTSSLHAHRKVEFAQRIIRTYREALGSKLTSELVRDLIAETGFDAVLAGLPRGAQRLANLRKILDWLRETERGARTTPAAVARKLAHHIKYPPQVPEAALLDPAQNAVTLMTVHGSKGLTQRVVFLPDISFRPDSDRSFARLFIDKNQRPMFGCKISAPDKSSVASPGFTAAGKRASAVRAHELKNLFYVAMTRARDLVVLSASPGNKPEGWLKEVEPFITNGTLFSRTYHDLRTAAPSAALNAPPIATAEQLSRAAASVPPPPPVSTLRRIPATTLAKAEQPKPAPSNTRSGNKRARATELGTLGHAVLEQLALNDWTGSATHWIEQLHATHELKLSEAKPLIPLIEQTVELIRELTADMKELQPELPFVLLEQNTLIDGTIDLLTRTENGFAIFDYKFTEANDAKVLQTYRRQMQIYHQAAERIYPYAAESRTHLIVISSTGPRVVPVD